MAGFWPKPVSVETAQATEGSLRSVVQEEGRTRVKQRYIVTAPVTGMLRRIELKAGARVQAGDVVAVQDPAPSSLLDTRSRKSLEAQRENAMAAVAKAQSALAFANVELKRFETLFRQAAVSAQELDVNKLKAEAASKDEQAAQSALRQVEAELGDALQSDAPPEQSPVAIKAPANGFILKVYEESAKVVTAGTRLLEEADPADLEVIIEVLSRDGAAVLPGTKVEFAQWGGPELLEGRVRLVEPSAFTKISALGVEEQRVNVIADLVTPYEKRTALGDNYRVDARIIMWEADRVLKAPAGALFRQGTNWAAYVIESSRAKLRKVSVGQSSGSEVQILDGLRAGDTLVLYPGNRVKDGQAVKPLKL